LASKIETLREELKTLAERLPFKRIDLEEFDRPGSEPERIRQARHFPSPDPGSQVIGRFLVERGVVELLPPEHTLALFREIHWSAAGVRRLAAGRYEREPAARAALVEARRLISRIEQAEEELFIANRRLIVACVKPYFWIGPVWLSDFLQEGSKALSNAIRKFDFTRGTPFYAYSQKAIQNRLRNYFRDHIRSGSIAVRPSEDMLRVKAINDRWKKEHGAEAPIATLAQLTGLSEDRVQRLRPLIAQYERLPGPPLSLDAAVGDSTTSFHELIEDPDADQAAFSAEKAEVWAAVDRLPDRSRDILRLRFLDGRTLEEVGDQMRLTRARIKQIQDDALRKLRHLLRRGPLDE
jgi:RNA polymerase primary sigma factor